MKNLIIAIDQSTSATKAMLLYEYSIKGSWKHSYNLSLTNNIIPELDGWNMMLKKFIGMC